MRKFFRVLSLFLSFLLTSLVGFVAKLLSALRIHDSAVSLVRWRQRQAPDFASVLSVSLAEMFERSGRLDEVVRCLNDQIEKEPNFAEHGYLELGLIYEGHAQYGPAAAHLERSLALYAGASEGYRAAMAESIEELKQKAQPA